MPPVAACPAWARYQELAAGRLAGRPDAEVLLAHLERCDACAGKLPSLPGPDPLGGLLRQAQACGKGAGLARLIDRLASRRSGDTSSVRHAETLPPRDPSAALLTADCPACGKAVKARPELAGKRVKCPYCKQPLRLPAAHEPSPAPPPIDAGAGGTPSAYCPPKEAYDFLAPPQGPGELGRLGPYRVLKVLGAGGMGVVFQAEDPQLARPVALKAMLPALAASVGARERFLREARAAAAVKHDHVVTIYQVGEDRCVPFLAMELLEGEPLDARLDREGKLPVRDVLRIGREVALGLAAAHRRGLIHRDVKPANVWLEADTGRAKILDFGLARAAGEASQLTQQGAVVGTPAYMAPEQAQSQTIDVRCDLFSLGCVLYRMATGEPAFEGAGVVGTLIAVATVDPRPPRELDAALPPALSDLILQLLAKDPAARPPSARAVAETLEEFAREPAALPTAEPLRPAPVARPAVRKKGLVAVVVVAGLLLGLVGLWAAGVFKVKTKEGTIVMEGVPAHAEVLVDGERVALTLAGDGRRIEVRVAPGKRKLEIQTAGFKMETREVAIAAGERQPVTIRLEPLTPAAPGPAAQHREAVPDTLPPTFRDRRGMEFVRVPRGKAWLGGGGGKAGDQQVEIAADFYLGKYEVTQEEWEDVMGKRPSHFSRTGRGHDAVQDIPDLELKRFPVEMVSWDDCQQFLARLNQSEKEGGWVYRLPTEVEWEYACRGGPMADPSDGAFHFYFGKPTNWLAPDLANFTPAPRKGLRRTCRVGSYEPNRLGLHDMHGNVWEWCAGEPPGGPPAALLQQVRGGSWAAGPDGRACCRAGFHLRPLPRSYRSHDVGFRVARVPAGKDGPPALAKGAEPKSPPQRPPFPADPERRAAEWALSVGGAVSVRVGGIDLDVRAGGQLPADPFVLRGINVSSDVYGGSPAINRALTDDDGLRHLEGLTRLVRVDLHNTAVTDAGLAHLKGLTGLQELALFFCPQVSDVGVEHLRGLTNLRDLDLNSTRVTDAGLAHLQGMPKLRTLNLMTTRVSGAGFVHLQGLTQLQTLWLSNSQVDDAGLAHLGTRRSLTQLSLEGTRVTDAGLVHLRGLTKLTLLGLGGPRVSAAGLVHVKGLTELTLVGLRGPQVSDAWLEALRGLSKLRDPYLHDSKVTPAGIAAFQKARPGCHVHVQKP